MAHWTYEETVESDSDLQQGDILSPTPELTKVFEEVHPHFSDSKYLGFLVITQSCDLVRRNDQCSSDYINVAAVRSLSAVLVRLLESLCIPVKPGLGIFSEKDRQKAHDLLTRIFNQNEQKLGLFYLYPDGDVGLGEDAVAFLRVSVAFRSAHYTTLAGARRGRLNPEFTGKLGWLVGNLFSRVATRDWEPRLLTQQIRSHLNSKESVAWIRSEALGEIDAADLSRDEILSQAKKKTRSPQEIGIARIIRILGEVARDALESDAVQRLEQRLKNDPDLKSLFKR